MLCLKFRPYPRLEVYSFSCMLLFENMTLFLHSQSGRLSLRESIYLFPTL